MLQVFLKACSDLRGSDLPGFTVLIFTADCRSSTNKARCHNRPLQLCIFNMILQTIEEDSASIEESFQKRKCDDWDIGVPTEFLVK